MKRTFSVTLILFLFVWAFAAKGGLGKGQVKPTLGIQLLATSQEIQFLAANPSIQAQVTEIDRQISELQGMKRGFEARALRHEDQAQRLQFENRAWLETRRHLELADENRAKANRVQQEIERLQIERRKLLQ